MLNSIPLFRPIRLMPSFAKRAPMLRLQASFLFLPYFNLRFLFLLYFYSQVIFGFYYAENSSTTGITS